MKNQSFLEILEDMNKEANSLYEMRKKASGERRSEINEILAFYLTNLNEAEVGKDSIMETMYAIKIVLPKMRRRIAELKLNEASVSRD